MGIKLDGIGKVFEGSGLRVRALESVGVDVDDGEFVSIVGPSGCGKSTLLRIVAGVIPPTEGEVVLNGRKVDGPLGNVGFVFQHPTLFKWRTVIKNVMFPYEVLASQGRAEGSRQEYEERAIHLLEMTGLVDFRDAYPKQLSGGMQQRVSICRALLPDPPILLMDEPFGALDEFTRERMNFELLRIWEETEKTVLFVTHHIPEAVYLSDRVVALTSRPGTVAGTVEVNLERPRGKDVRDGVAFLEHMVTVRKLIGFDAEREEGLVE